MKLSKCYDVHFVLSFLHLRRYLCLHKDGKELFEEKRSLQPVHR